jgi:hypothetical protein
MNRRRDHDDEVVLALESTRWPFVRSAVAALVSLTVLGAIGAALIASNQRMPGPSGWTYPELEAWIGRRPVSAAFCLVSTVALVVVLYLMLSTMALLVARAARAARLPCIAHIAEAAAVPVIRRSLAAMIGLGLTVATHSTPALAAPPTTPATAVTGRATTDGPIADDDPELRLAIMRSLEPAGSPLPGPASTTNPSPAEATWTILPGDHLWGLAESALTTAWARTPSDFEVADYVGAIVELNHHVLVLPGHPDLVFPGQVFERPAMPEP